MIPCIFIGRNNTMLLKFLYKTASLNALIIFIFLFAGCSSSGGSKDSGKKGRTAKLDCSANPPVLSLFHPEGDLLYKGPVALAAGEDCKKTAGLPDSKVRKLSKEGIWYDYYKGSSAVLREGLYRKNKEEGLFRFYTKEKQLSRTVNYKDGKKEGEEVIYFPGTDEWKIHGQNSDNMKSGIWEERMDRSASCISKGAYKNNEKFGPWDECDREEKTEKIYNSFTGGYLEGLKNGPATTFYPDGATQSSGSYIADLACLKNPPPQGKDLCAKKTGLWYFYYPDGKRSQEGTYDGSKGTRSGKWTEYYRSGEKMAEGGRSHTRTGIWVFYDKKGSIIGKYIFQGSENFIKGGQIYENGVLAAETLPGVGCRRTVNRLGKEVDSCQMSPGGFGAALVKYNAAEDKLEFTLKMQNGRWAVYSAKGQKIGEGEFLNGRKHGKWKELEGGTWQNKNYMMGKPQ